MISIINTAHIKKVIATCDNCGAVFQFAKEDARSYPTDYTNPNVGYVAITCPTPECKNSIFKDFKDFV